MAYVNTFALLEIVGNAADRLDLCSQEPTTYTQARTTYSLANKAAPTVLVQRVSTTWRANVGAIADGTVTASTPDDVTHWALTGLDASDQPVLFATGAVQNGQVVYAGNTFSLAAFSAIILPDAV